MGTRIRLVFWVVEVTLGVKSYYTWKHWNSNLRDSVGGWRWRGRWSPTVMPLSRTQGAFSGCRRGRKLTCTDWRRLLDVSPSGLARPPVTPFSKQPRPGRPHARAHAQNPAPPCVTEWPRTQAALTCRGGRPRRYAWVELRAAEGKQAERPGRAWPGQQAERRSRGGEHALLTYWRWVCGAGAAPPEGAGPSRLRPGLSQGACRPGGCVRGAGPGLEFGAASPG